MAKETPVYVPDIGDFDAVDVIEVLVAPGDHVEADAGLITLETDKATMEVPAPQAGTIQRVAIEVGAKVRQGDIIAHMSTTPDQATSDPADTPARAPEPPARKVEKAQTIRTFEPVDPTSGQPRLQKAEHTPPVRPNSSDLATDLPYASPSVRRYARELGVNLAQVTGTGRKGRILSADVQTYIKARLGGAGSAAGGGLPGLNLAPAPRVDFAKYGRISTQALSRIQKLSGANLARNWITIPHVTQHEQADITELEAFRRANKHHAEQRGAKLTPLVFIIKAVVAALKAYPQFNASLDETSENLVLKHYFHIGVAVDTPNGLVVPVLRDCDRKGMLDLAVELGEISARAREGKLKPDEMKGGSLSISSLGGIGGTKFTPIVNAPEVAILGVSRSEMVPIWDGETFQPRRMLPLSLSYDHRVIDGAAAARFVVHLRETLGDIRRLVL